MLTGCNKENEYKLAFSHNLHVTENGIACADCHGKPTGGHFSAAGHDACKECHGDWIETKEIGEKTCGKCHKAKDPKYLPKAEYSKPASNAVAMAGGLFRHTEALTNRCADCHGLLMDKKLTLVPEFTRKEKVRIRDQAHRWEMSCSACHEKMDRRTPPPSHAQNWTRRHGEMGTQPDNACGVCHSEKSCRECHQVTMPASHNNLWRLKTHGIQAAWDRQRCLVCHRQDSCSACHASTRPQTHNAAWNKTHCNNCHPGKSTGTGCTLCHATDISSHPNPHSAGWLQKHCNNCHPGTPDAENCAVCHGWSGIGSHPNPHSSGWRSSHCNSCHAGTPEAEKCVVCHPGGLAAHPDPHPSGWRNSHCNSCHANTPDAAQCNVCHAGGIAGHPNPHAAGWRSRHCTNCHIGASEPNNCSICHGITSIADHPDPHPVGWQSNHCHSCHPGTPEAAQCAFCHKGGSGLQIHQSSWPPFHNRFGGTVNVSICYDCHDNPKRRGSAPVAPIDNRGSGKR